MGEFRDRFNSIPKGQKIAFFISAGTLLCLLTMTFISFITGHMQYLYWASIGCGIISCFLAGINCWYDHKKKALAILLLILGGINLLFFVGILIYTFLQE